MELYSDEEFSFRYGFSKAAAAKILQELCLRENSDRRGAPLPSLLKLLIALRFYGPGAMQTVVGDLVNVSQPTVSNVLWEITQAVCLCLLSSAGVGGGPPPVTIRFETSAPLIHRKGRLTQRL